MVVDFPAPFGPRRLKHLPLPDFEIDLLHCHEIAKMFLQILDLNGFWIHLSLREWSNYELRTGNEAAAG